MLYRYTTIELELFSDDIGNYRAFGIAIADSEENVILTIPDVSTDRSFVERLCRECTEHNLSPIHIYDVIEDKFGEDI